MGIRVHKVIGWGINNFVEPEKFSQNLDSLYEIEKEEFLLWVVAHKEKIKTLSQKEEKKFDLAWMLLISDIKDQKHNPPGRAISYDSEFGLKGHLVISPFEMIDQCKRYNDLIDWVEEGEEPRWSWLIKPIYPFELGEKSLSVISVCLYLGIEKVIPDLKEVLYVYWS